MDYGFFVLPALTALGTWKGGVYTIGVGTEKWAEHLERTYDFQTVKPEEAVEQIDLARRRLGVSAIVGSISNRALKAAHDLAQAYVKSAYLVGLAARYLDNRGLAEAAYYNFLVPLDDKFRNTKDKGAIAAIYKRAVAMVQSTAEANGKLDAQIRYLLSILGDRTYAKAGTSTIEGSIGVQQAARIDPAAERAAIEAKLAPGAVLESGLDTASDLQKSLERKLKAAKRKERNQKRKARNLTIAVGVGSALLVTLVAVTILRSK